ncbi:MAG: GntR family transcriptional regulator [Martelella sp.]|uniref:GntR family transcriptional regulator n=1 Tax=Martelella sp. TaxID=1969699 RepID=UPI003242DDBC
MAVRVFQDFDISGDGPIYRRLKAELARAVESGKLAHGEALPPERDLARIVGVSRVTVRRAIAELTSEGFLQRRHGAGTFVLRPPARIEQPLKRLTSFTEDMQARGLTPRSHWLERGLFSANAEEAEGLKLTENAAVARLSRIRLGDDLPMAIEHSTLPADILERPDLVETSLYGALAERGVTMVRAEERITACNLTAEQAALLTVSPGAPALAIRRTGFEAGGRPVELTRTYYRSDIYDLVAELTYAGDP